MNSTNILFISAKQPVTKINVNISSFNGQNRLLLKQISLFEAQNEDTFYEYLSDLTRSVATSISYSGQPLKLYNGTLSDVIYQNKYGHCGIFAYLFFDKIESAGGDALVYDLANNGSYHSVVLVKDPYSQKWIVTDPTLGIVYNESFEKLKMKTNWTIINDKVATESAYDQYYGKDFWNPNLKIKKVYTNRSDLEITIWHNSFSTQNN